MDSKILDGKTLALKHEDLLKQKLSQKKHSPKIVSFCNEEDNASVMYTNMKKQKAGDLRIEFIAENYSSATPKDEIVKKIEKYNDDSGVDGIMIQLPLPESLNGLLDLIDPQKDVDGLVKESHFLPATVKGVISILDEYIKGWETKIIAVVGALGSMGEAVTKALKERGTHVIEIDKKISASNLNDCRDAEIVISCAGVRNLIILDHIREGAILIDVGLGDFDPATLQKASLYTPEKGGVGPMTVISLMENVVESYEKRE